MLLGKTIFGYNGFFYRQQLQWGVLDQLQYPVNDCHEIVQDKNGRIYVLTNDTTNNVLVYDRSGKLLDSWGHDFPGAHGLTITDEGGMEFLFITDIVLHKVFKTSLAGEIVFTLSYPAQAGLYKKEEEFMPTETAVTKSGDFYIADGYGKQYILHYSHDGMLKGWFGGRGDEEWHLDNAHGICIDNRTEIPTLLVTDRTKCCFKRFSLEGVFAESIVLPGACVCRPVIYGDMLYAAVLRSPDMNNPDSGFIVILNYENNVVSTIGGSKPEYKDRILQPMYQQEKIFKHPHDVCVDAEGSIYVTQWSSGRLYPYKFIRV